MCYGNLGIECFVAKVNCNRVAIESCSAHVNKQKFKTTHHVSIVLNALFCRKTNGVTFLFQYLYSKSLAGKVLISFKEFTNLGCNFLSNRVFTIKLIPIEVDFGSVIGAWSKQYAKARDDKEVFHNVMFKPKI